MSDAKPSEQPGPIGLPATARSLPDRLRAVYGKHIGPSERALLLSWASFGATFGTARVITHRLRKRGGLGGIGVHGQEAARRHPLTAIAYGAGVALIVDELALLLDLQDVYWAKDGRTSVDVGILAIAVGGLYFAAAPFWTDAAREFARTRALRA